MAAELLGSRNDGSANIFFVPCQLVSSIWFEPCKRGPKRAQLVRHKPITDTAQHAFEASPGALR
jgi:hypothetical protein